MRFNPPSQGFASSVVFFSAAFWGLYWIPLALPGRPGASAAAGRSRS